jgi:nucleoside 2-deoxyribosyltransferase
MKIAMIGSTHYTELFKEHKRNMEVQGHDVKLPAFDDHLELDELGVCEYNRELIEWADEVHIVWDQRSMGTVFDFGMAFAMRKPIRVVFIEPKTFAGVMRKYELNMHPANNI